jgi:hypothetical protein
MAIKLSDGQIEIDEILHGETSILKIAVVSTFMADAREVLIIPLCVTTQIFLPGYSPTKLNKP